MSDDDNGKQVGLLANAWTLAVLFPASLAAGALLGWWLDRMFHTSPWLTVVGLFLGAAAAFLNLAQFVKKSG